MQEKVIIYQVFTRLFGNQKTPRKANGTVDDNGCGKFNDLDAAVLSRIRQMGVTHMWFTGVIRHATTTDYTQYGIPRQTPMVVKGRAGSPYAITDYYDVDPDMAVDVDRRMEEFEAMVERTHRAGMKVIIDFVPNHVAREYHSICKPSMVRDLGEDDDRNLHFSTANNFYYCWGNALDTSLLPDSEGPRYEEAPAKATGNDHFDNRPGANDWYETVKLNYGIDYCDAGGRSEHFCPIPDTWSKMTHILMFWASKGIDAFRCDMAEMVPAAFWHWATDKVKYAYPEVKFIGEVYNPAEYRNYIGAGFDYLYDKVGMYDCLRDVVCQRRWAADITRQWQVNDDIRSHMLYFLENHDEQRIASDFFAGDARKAIPGVIVAAWLLPSPFMLYAGQEFGERGMDEEGFSGLDGRTTIFDYWSVDTVRRGFFERRKQKKAERQLEQQYAQILKAANEEDALREGDMYDLMYVNPQLSERQFAFLRKRGKQLVLVVANFSGEDVACEVRIPRHVFEFWQMKGCDVMAADLISGETVTVSLQPDQSVSMRVPCYVGRAYKMILP